MNFKTVINALKTDRRAQVLALLLIALLLYILYKKFILPKMSTVTNPNLKAILKVIRTTEGTEKASNPYAVTYGYKHTIKNFSDHPTNTGEWSGGSLPTAYCNAAGYGSGCVSTAAGAYQFIRPTWNSLKSKLGLSNFGADAQDRAAIELIKQRGAYQDVLDGNITNALKKISKEWASLPFATAGQPKYGVQDTLNLYKKFGGKLVS